MHEPYASCVEIHDVSLNVIHARMNKTQSLCDINSAYLSERER